VLDLAEEWLGDFGLGLLPDSSSAPDAWAQLDPVTDGDRWAFRFDNYSKRESLVVVVTINQDTPARCVALEVRR
jgi:hypothetical protein